MDIAKLQEIQNDPDALKQALAAPNAAQGASTPTPPADFTPPPMGRVFPGDVLSLEKRKLIELSGENDELKERLQSLEKQIETLLLRG